MKKYQGLLTILPGIVFFSSVEGAQLVQINEQNVAQYLNEKNQSMVIKGSHSQFVLKNKIVLSNGVVKYKYLQYSHGIPVFSTLLTHSETSTIKTNWWGTLLSGIDGDIKQFKPQLTANEALLKAKQSMKIDNPSSTRVDQSTLYIKQNKTTKRAELVYIVSFYMEGNKPQRPHFIIDAMSGEIIHQWEGLTTRDANGPGGNEKTGLYTYGTDYPSFDVSDTCEMKNPMVETYNLNGLRSGGTLFQFNCPTNTFKKINGAYSPLNDAHYFGGIVYQMYKNWYGMEPLNTVLRMRVHYGNNYENAYWDGEQMTFGDGGSDLYPLTVLDVTGHEISHGVTEQNSNLIYEFQSGGINEAFSDMAGETAENYRQTLVGKTNDWIIGANVIKGPAGTGLRYFADPTRDGASIDHAKDYRDDMDVHYSSGVYNKAFYNLATTPDWGIRKAFEVFLTANRVYWTSDATFETAACGVNKAAGDFNYPIADVIKSFQDVGVDATCGIDINEIEILNGQTISKIAINKDQELHYFISLPSVIGKKLPYKSLVIKSVVPQRDTNKIVELFVRFDKNPVEKQDHAVFNTETFTILKPTPGTYHILLKGKNKGLVNLSAVFKP